MKRFGYIKRPKVYDKKVHICKLPFKLFGPELNDLFRCKCGKVYVFKFDWECEWQPTTIKAWAEAGGSE